MVFGIFSRKPAVTVSAPIQPTDNVSKPSLESHRVQQLRTPSPSVVSGSVCNPNNSPTFSTIRPHSNLMSSPDVIPPETNSPPPPPPPADPSALYSFLLTIPPRILYEYTLAQLNPNPSSPITEPLSPLTLAVLSSFYSALTPPPLLHCARCHKGFFEVENNDRSCTVPHDDESAEVERVGRSTGPRAGEYETLWGCCGKTVEGDGDMGPPDGWCYEGRHTTDPKRARFRADSTIYDDKLTSCAKLHCHDPPPSPSTRKTRKRPRKAVREESGSDGDGSEGQADSGMEEMVNVKKARRSASVSASVRSKKGATSKGKRKARADEGMDEDVEKSVANDEKLTSVSMASIKVKPKSSAKPRSRAKAPTTPRKPASISAPAKVAADTPRTSSRVRNLKSTLTKRLEEVADSEDEKPKKRRKVA